MPCQPDNLKMVQCPFNPRHVFTNDRLQTHIFKCMRNYPGHVACPYNALHRFVNKDDLLPHILVCPSKSNTQSWKYVKPEKHGDLTDPPYHVQNPKNDDDEEWDSEYRN